MSSNSLASWLVSTNLYCVVVDRYLVLWRDFKTQVIFFCKQFNLQTQSWLKQSVQKKNRNDRKRFSTVPTCDRNILSLPATKIVSQTVFTKYRVSTALIKIQKGNGGKRWEARFYLVSESVKNTKKSVSYSQIPPKTFLEIMLVFCLKVILRSSFPLHRCPIFRFNFHRRCR